MKQKIINGLAKILLSISIILVMVYILSFVIGIFSSYNSGVEKTWLFGGSIFGTNDIVYGKEAINVYFKQSIFAFGILSMCGILPMIFIPIIISILGKFKKVFLKIKLKYVLIIFSICIIVHILVYVKFNEWLLLILPYIESIIISYLIAIKFKSNETK